MSNHDEQLLRLAGVCWIEAHQTWTAYISANKRKTHLGSFTSLFEAACARKSAENRLGYHRNHGAKK